MKHRSFADLIPWPAVVTPRLCRRFPGQNRGVSGRTGTHRDTPWRPWSYTGNAQSQTLALPGHTVIKFCPKPDLVRSTAGNIWTHSNFVPIRPGLPAANCRDARGVHRDSVHEARVARTGEPRKLVSGLNGVHRTHQHQPLLRPVPNSLKYIWAASFVNRPCLLDHIFSLINVSIMFILPMASYGLSTMIIYNSIWSVLIQWIRVILSGNNRT